MPLAAVLWSVPELTASTAGHVYKVQSDVTKSRAQTQEPQEGQRLQAQRCLKQLDEEVGRGGYCYWVAT